MRNLKKILALVLALVMSLSLVTIANAAAFKDQAKIDDDYSEAVAVMAAIKVLEGDETTGNFNPNGTLTRAQAAKIITYMKLGPVLAGSLGNTDTGFTDVKASHWSSGSVAYCASEGIITGVGGGKFNPTGTLTGYQFGKMLLEAVGINKGNYNDDSTWKINVAVALNGNSLLDGLDVKLSEPLSREKASQMAFNALRAGGETVTTTSTRYVIMAGDKYNTADAELGKLFGTDYDSLAAAKKAATDAKSGAVLGSDYTVVDMVFTSSTEKGSLADTVFGLTNKTATDAAGRPVSTWTASKVKGASVTLESAPVIDTYTAISGAELYNKLGAKASIAIKVLCAVNSGISEETYKTVVDDKVNPAGLGGNGIHTEIYKTGNNLYQAIITVPTLAKVTNVTNVKATASAAAYTKYTIGDVEMTSKNTTFAVPVAKDDYVLLTVVPVFNATGSVENNYSVTPVTTVTGAVTRYTSSGVYTIAGSAYTKSAIALANGITAIKTGTNTTSATYALDAEGNVIAAIQGPVVNAAKNYMFVLRADKASYLDTATNRVTEVAEALVITADGQLTTVQVGKLGDKTAIDEIVNLTAGLYSYAPISGSSKLALTSETAKVTQIKKGTPEIAKDVYANNATVYYVAQKDANGAYTGVTKYVGFNNVPNLTINKVATGYIAGSNIATVVFVDAGAEEVAGGASANYVYVTGTYSEDANGKTYDVIVKGEKTTMVLINDEYVAAGLYAVTNGKAEELKASKTFGNGWTPADGDYYSATVGFRFTYKEGVLFRGQSTADDQTTYVAAIGADVPVYIFENYDVTVSTAESLNAMTSNNGPVVIAVKDGAIVALYFVVK